MSEQEDRRMLIQKLKQAYLMNYGEGLSGGKRRVRKRKPKMVGGRVKKVGRPRKAGRPKKRRGGELVDNFYGEGLKRKRRVRKRRGGELVDNFYCGGELIDSDYGMMLGGRRRVRKRRVGTMNPWVMKVKKYAKQHGISYKDAMTQLGSK